MSHQERRGGARARRRERKGKDRGESWWAGATGAGRRARRPVSRSVMGRIRKAAGFGGAMPPPSGRTGGCDNSGAGARDLRITLVVAGLKAEPVARLAGGPSGASALSIATAIASHRARMKDKRPFMLVPACDGIMRLAAPLRPLADRAVAAQKPPLKPEQTTAAFSSRMTAVQPFRKCSGRLTSASHSSSGPHSRAGRQGHVLDALA